VSVRTSEAPPVTSHHRLARWMPRLWWLLCGAIGLEAIGELTGFHAPDPLFVTWLHNGIAVAAAILCLAAVREEPRSRGAWLAFGTGLALWALAGVLWSAMYGLGEHAPYPTVSDVLWLAWYPATAVGMALLIRVQLTRFELHRWLDGIAVMLILLIPAAVFVLGPVAEQTRDSTLAEIVDFSYPILDLILLGAILGVFAVTAWRPGRVWLVLAVGIGLMTISDATYAVQQAAGTDIQTDYDFLWSIGALTIAYAAWMPITEPAGDQELIGWRAIALPLAAQLIAGVIQIYGLFEEIGRSERVVTLAVLAIASVQIVLSRPRGSDKEHER
jgi:hypothetical protein